MTIEDYIALGIFLLLWGGFSWATDGRRNFKRVNLTRLMNEHRARWIRNSLNRDLKMIDTQIIAGLQAGTAFFASTTIFALGGCFALLGATEQVQMIFNDLPHVFRGGRAGFELKVGGLTCLFGYSFFQFGWSYRLFNYCSILMGGIPMTADMSRDRRSAEQAAERAIRMNIMAAKHFNAGLRAIFLSIGYLGWFVGPYVFIVLTGFVIFVLTRRQFFSEAREALLAEGR
ncbi:DUF599 domain-containing protein [Sinorhizobium alkalisoli]|uniref:Uncharacterized protein n=1 Tax=Sinorhizobium alkalisoli TaxID=1752398 RepID=A0A1E3VEI6_9HYPH|nr:DUF599 domain-containing protein [Sinorhizobium alkalisoli]MCA1492899.1 DUF599 domain-containing protein [Ensifer sp. NBAIM29]MCG5481057.1 DUF599 domain-containing protein [Sinorhizobium alkalisoli]ODR91944.1 hypothetical protein A8M32_08135 [Sinorhizobium alkalisoli]QFI66049.1 hypothetical protein EKH55_1175 [Sinorhizobium alkalisoli]